MECNLTLDTFWGASWYELGLLSKQKHYQVTREWDYTRHIMAAMGAGKGDPRKVLKLPLIDGGPGRNAPKSIEHAKEIANRLLQYLPVKKENGVT